MATARDVVTAALVELGVLPVGDTATTDDANFGFAALNRLVDQWAAERLQIYVVTRTLFNVVGAQVSYTVGPSGNINIARPVFIEHVNWVNLSSSPSVELQLEPLTEDAYSRLPTKGLTAAIPTCWYYTPTFPQGTLYLWPIPTSSATNGAALYAPTAVTQFTDLSSAVSLPPGYERMLVKNLAVELGPSFARQIDPQLFRQALEAKETVKRANKRLLDMAVERGALVQGSNRISYDIRVGP